MPAIDTMFDSPGEPELHITLSYPRIEGNTNTIRLELGDVRAADDLIITFDFERNGWRIGMDTTRQTTFGMDTIDQDQEVAFIPAWNERTAHDE